MAPTPDEILERNDFCLNRLVKEIILTEKELENYKNNKYDHKGPETYKIIEKYLETLYAAEFKLKKLID